MNTNAPKLSGLIRLCIAVFLGCLTVGISLATIPGYVHETLHFSNLVVGLAIGIQSAATLASRHYAGIRCDTRGSRSAVISGSILTAIAGLFYLLSLSFHSYPALSLGILILGRLIHGLGESLLITGSLSWGIGLAGHERSGKVMAWVGIAIYGALACGAPLCMLLRQPAGPAGPFTAMTLSPIAALVCIAGMSAIQPTGGKRVPFYTVMRKIGLPGTGLLLGTVGFACIASFITLYFRQKGWTGASAVLTVFGAAYILVRLFFAHLPDRLGGGKVAFVSLWIEAAGQALIWVAPSPAVALAGAALTGIGFSLVFPSFGVAAVRKMGPENKGIALGAYVAFFDLAFGITAPLAGWIAGGLGYPAIYGFGTCAVLAAIAIAYRLKK